MYCKNKGKKYVMNILSTICVVLRDIGKCVGGYGTGSTDKLPGFLFMKYWYV